MRTQERTREYDVFALSRRVKKLSIAIGIVLLAAVGWYLLSPIWRVQIRNDPSPLERSTSEGTQQSVEGMPSGAHVLAQAQFVVQAHDVKGKAVIVEQGGIKIVRFEDFETINGPNLHIYLSADLEGKDYIDLGPIRATKGNVNYDLPAGIDTGKYHYVLVWCVPFGVLFSYASL